MSDDAPSGVLSKALAVLQAFTVEDTTLGFTELRRRTGFAKSTLHRVLGDLVAARLLDRVQERYRLSGLVFELGMRASVERGLLDAAPTRAAVAHALPALLIVVSRSAG